MQKLTEKTFIPISLVIVLVGGVSWLNSVHAGVKYNTEKISAIHKEKDETQKTLRKILEELGYIRGLLEK